MKCPKCHFDNLEASSFCSKCGIQIQASSAEIPFSPTITLKTSLATLTKGTTFGGKYKILEEIGRGGMGVVYKAQDLHLDRFVALKILPPERVADPDRKRRFIHEAKSASALNHPNIIVVYDIDCDSGVDFIVMEFVSGKTLTQVIGRKGLATGETLKFALQISDALAAAHGAGIIHRDLKPENIMITDKGAVKVLDFGLAKLTEPDIGVEELAITRTVPAQTEEGMIMGTVAYMSPEQAEGKKVDARSDIFSFGTLLYEMLTGQQAFQRDSKTSTLAAILHEEPKPVSQVAAETPRELEKVIMRCLRKDAGRRYQHMDDVKLALEELKEESDSGQLVTVQAPSRRIRLPHWLVITGGIVLVAASVGVTWWLARSHTPAPAPVLTRLTSDSGLTTDPALSPDGKLLAYASDRSGEGNLDIWVQQIGGGEPIRLTRDTADEHELCFSPDGTQIVFRSEREGGGIYLIPALGGASRRIALEGRDPKFSPDGNQIAYWTGHIGGAQLNSGNSKIYILAIAGGTPKQVQPEFAGAAYPVWTPDANHISFLGNRDDKLPVEQSLDWWVAAVPEPGPQGIVIKTNALDATRAQKLLGLFQVYPWALAKPAWSPSGDSLVFSARSGDSTNLWRIGISTKSWKVVGSAQRLTYGAALEERPTLAPLPKGGQRVAYASLLENTDIWSLPLDANRGKVGAELRRLTENTGLDFHPSISADGKKMVFVSERSGRQEVWMKNLQSGEESALTRTSSNKFSPILSPDGSKLAYSGYENGKWNLYIAPTAGGGSEMICKDCGAFSSWCADGKRVLIYSADGRVALLDLSSDRKTELLAHGMYRLYQPHFSPDERWITFIASSGGRSQVYVVPFRGLGLIPESEWIAVTDGQSWEDKLQWSPDGNLLYFTSDRDGFRCIWAQRLDAASKRPVGSMFPVFHSHSARLCMLNVELGLGEISVASDRLVFTMGERTGNIWMAEFR